jgi:hypothetical protein
MQISLTKFSMFLTGVVSIGLVVGTGYLLFTIFFGGPEADVVPTPSLANVSVFGPKMRNAAAALVDPKLKISLDSTKDLAFLSSPLFLSFTEQPDVIGLSKIRGRENPFVPLYVAP